jgi:hypothetical protein
VADIGLSGLPGILFCFRHDRCREALQSLQGAPVIGRDTHDGIRGEAAAVAPPRHLLALVRSNRTDCDMRLLLRVFELGVAMADGDLRLR